MEDHSLKKVFKTEISENDSERMEITNELEEGELSDNPINSTFSVEPEPESTAAVPSKCFSLVGDPSLSIPQEDLVQLYKSLGIDRDNERHYRFNSIHLRGVSKMSTKEILDYFSGLEPVNVEWLENGSCNVEWNDEILSARALLYLSIEITNSHKVFKTNVNHNESDDDDGLELNITDNSVDAGSLNFKLPSGRWRKGVSCASSKRIVMRYANQHDKQIRSKNLTTQQIRKRSSKHRKEVEEEPPKNPWGALAQTWGHGEGVETFWTDPGTKTKTDLRKSLNVVKVDRFMDFCVREALESSKVKREVRSSSSDSESTTSSEGDRRRKIPRMYADAEEEKKKFARMNSTGKSKMEDLRARLNSNRARRSRNPLLRKVESESFAVVHSEDSLEDGSDEWAKERYEPFRNSLKSRVREESLDEESDLALSDFEPAEMIRIEVDNEYFNKQSRRKRH